MDDRRFDDLARTLATGPASRRDALRLLGGGALASLLARLGVGAVAATHGDCRHLGERCTKAGQCCSGRCKKKPGQRRGRCACPVGTVADKGACIPRVACANDGDCDPNTTGKVCTNAGVCKCPPGEGDCAGLNQCGSLSSDPNFCGACDVKCAEGGICTNGVCGCPEGGSECGGVCKECCEQSVDCVGGTCDADGKCNCPSTVPVCNRQCCRTGQTCLASGCGSCPQNANYCNLMTCGPDCVCATKPNGTTGCFETSANSVFTCLPDSFLVSCSDSACQSRGLGSIAVRAEGCCASDCACVRPCGA